jgi:hypothetical protein
MLNGKTNYQVRNARRRCIDMAGGRPRIWETPELLQKDVDTYFEYCKTEKKHPTIAGLAYYTNVDRHTIYNYDKKDEYFHIIKKARDRIMMGLEETSIEKGNSGTIFVMKQYGYTDKQEVTNNVNANGFGELLGKFIEKL